MKRALWVGVLGLISFLIGSPIGQALVEGTEFPFWIFTWIGLALIVTALAMGLKSRRG